MNQHEVDGDRPSQRTLVIVPTYNERDNLRAAAQQMLESHDWESLADLSFSLYPYWWLAGLFGEEADGVQPPPREGTPLLQFWYDYIRARRPDVAWPYGSPTIRQELRRMPTGRPSRRSP